MQKHEVLNMIWLFLSWLAGTGILYLFLQNKEKEIKFRNVKSSFILGAAIGLVAAFAGSKANISFWLTWIIFAGAGAYVTYRLLNKQEDAAPGVYGKGRGLAKDEKLGWVISRIVIAMFGISFLVYGLFFHPECGIDSEFLACRLTGSIPDIIGVILIGGGLFVMSGLFREAEYLTNPIGSNFFNNALGVGLLTGAVLVWFF